MKRLAAVLLVASAAASASGAEMQALDGAWRFELDRKDEGVAARWFARELLQKAQLPGSITAQGIGDDPAVDTAWTGDIVDKSWFTEDRYAKYRRPGNIKVPFWLQPEKVYVGAAWYQRTVDIPPAWQGRRLVLFLERPHWETRVWLDERAVATNHSLSTPHEIDLGAAVAPGPHRLTIRVDNRVIVPVGPNSHSVSDHTQGNWNGIVGRIELRATPPVWIGDAQVFPDVAKKSARVRVAVSSAIAGEGRGEIAWEVRGRDPSRRAGDDAPRARGMAPVAWTADGGQAEWTIDLGADARPWDEFDPHLFELRLSLAPSGAAEAAPAREVVFGLREVSVRGTQIAVNGAPIFLRGTLECCIFPKTGHPPTDLEEWRRILRVAQAHGLNHLRFHSWCPPEAAFAAADELGFYFQVECATWANQGATVGDGPPFDPWLYAESERIVRAYGNHPSFLLLLYGNEPAGKNQGRFLGDWVNHWKAKDPRRLYSSASGWPQLPENQFHVTPDPRIQGWGQGLRSRINAKPPETVTDYGSYVAARKVPVVAHEIGQWCAYPNFDEIPKYTGLLKPRNFEVFREDLEAKGLGDLAPRFVQASGKLQTLCYKEDIEAELRTPGLGGFQLLDLHDFPGQGTALVGVLDPFWEPKGYVTAEEYRRFCGPIVPLARLPKRVFAADETLRAEVDVAQFGPRDLPGARVAWALTDDAGRVLAQGAVGPADLPHGRLTRAGALATPLAAAAAPARLKLRVSIPGTDAANDWDIWVYPRRVEDAAGDVLVTRTLDDAAAVKLRAGGKVLWLPAPSSIRADASGRVPAGFSSIFWNTAWTRRQPPHTLGILCDPAHPALARFPTDFHSNWQWWELVTRAHPFVLPDALRDLAPVVRLIDDWVTNRRLALVLEASVGPGSLVACGMDLEDRLDERLVARQLRASLLAYMNSPAFRPAREVALDDLRGLVGGGSRLAALGATIAADSAHEDHPADFAIDGDPATIWHTPWGEGAPRFPHRLDLDLGRALPLAGVALLPRQDKNPNGWIKDYAVYTSEDGRTWRTAAQGKLAEDATKMTIRFAAPAPARYLRVEAHSAFKPEPYASLAELELLEN